jgi:adenylate cyclase
MPNWTNDYYQSLVERFDSIIDGLDSRLADVIEGRVTPSLEDLTIGSARKLRAASLFFDIRNFSSRTSSPDLGQLKSALFILDCVIPMIMHVVYDYDGYIEKNTGDGILAIIGAEENDATAANSAIDIAMISFYLLNNLINPYLVQNDVEEINARVGIALGTLLISRIGTPTGSSKHPRNFLTAVGPSANLANLLQNMAGTNQTWVGDLVKKNDYESRQRFFIEKTPESWTWTYASDDSIYPIWYFNAEKKIPGE